MYTVMRISTLRFIILSLGIFQSRDAAEIILKYVDDNQLTLNVTEESKTETFELVKKKANVPTMLAEEDGIISNFELQVENS